MNFLQRLKIYNILGFVLSFILVVMYLIPSLLSEKNTLLNFSGTAILLGYVIGIIELFRRVPNVFIQEEETINANDGKNFVNPIVIKIPETIKGLIKEKNYFILNRVSTKIQINDTLMKLGFIDNSKIDGYPIFEILNSRVKVNNAMNFENIMNDSPTVNFINEDGYVIIESDITGNFPSKGTKGNYVTVKDSNVYYKTAQLVRTIEDHTKDYTPMNERSYQI